MWVSVASSLWLMVFILSSCIPSFFLLLFYVSACVFCQILLLPSFTLPSPAFQAASVYLCTWFNSPLLWLCFVVAPEVSFAMSLNTPSCSCFLSTHFVTFTSCRMWTPFISLRTPESSTCRTLFTWRTGLYMVQQLDFIV